MCTVGKQVLKKSFTIKIKALGGMNYKDFNLLNGIIKS